MEEKDKKSPATSSDEVALELMKFIATSTAYGKPSQQVGFAGKGAPAAEEQAEALLDLFRKCRAVVREGDSAEKS